MGFCTSCGANIPDGYAVCPSCGQRNFQVATDGQDKCGRCGNKRINYTRPLYTYQARVSTIGSNDPLDYEDFIAMMIRSTLILTDSGGVQEEAPSLGKPVLVMRDTTERPEALAAGTVKLVGTNHHLIVEEVSRLLTDEKYYACMSEVVNPYGDGKACERISKGIQAYFDTKEQQ